jgi:hypothetical protein
MRTAAYVPALNRIGEIMDTKGSHAYFNRARRE